MDYNEEKLEIELDEALDEALFDTPCRGRIYATPTKELLRASEIFVNAQEDAAARASFSKLIPKLSQSNSSVKNNMTQNNPQQRESIFTKIGNAIARQVAPFTLIKVGGGLLIVVVAVYSVGSFVVNQLVTATTSGGAGSPGNYSGGGGNLQMAQESGLGASDIRVSNPMARAVSAVGGMFKSDESAEYYPMPPDYSSQNDIRDTREYLKTSYYASLKTRNPGDLAERAAITVRGFGGRVDNANISDMNSYISFALPKDKFAEFREEIKTFVGAKFIKENISSQNLLPQKQVIEKNTDKTTASLAELTKVRNELTKKHNATLALLNKQLAAKEVELRELENAVPIDYITPEDETAMSARKAELRRQIASLKNQIAAENSSYQQKLNSYNTQINSKEKTLDNLAEQDTNLDANVETVEGSLSFTKISTFQMLNTYCYGFLPLITVVAFVLIVYFIARRSGAKPDIQPVQ
ncbi:MAG: hypothetical protein Q7K39_00200 [Candidatus Magasanikbacteria bacterium]|nr:hypothetical protein [Candidatus Magasanikbacteria bacterium]